MYICPPSDQITHVTEEEGQQQSSNMASVDVGVGHDNNLAITTLADIHFVFATGR